VPLLAISYRRQDSEAITGRIFDRLTLAYGKDAVFRDIDSIPAGTDFREHISGVLGRCDLLIVVIGRRWSGRTRGGPSGRIGEQTDLVRIEVETALHQNLPIIPVLVGNAQMPAAEDLPDSLKPLAFRNAIKVDAGQDFDNHISRLLRSIDGLVHTKEKKHSHTQTIEQVSNFRKNLSNWLRVSTIAAIIVAVSGLGLVVYKLETSTKKNEQTNAPQPQQPSAQTATQPGELQALLDGNDSNALEAYMQKHPGDPRYSELAEKLSDLKRAEFTEWTIYDVSTKLIKPNYLKLSSIRIIDTTRMTMEKKSFIDKSRSPPPNVVIEDDTYNKDDTAIYHHKHADPQYVDYMTKPTNLSPHTIGYDARTIACNTILSTPLVSKKELADMKFDALTTAPGEKGEDYFKPVTSGSRTSGDKTAILVYKLHADGKLADVFPATDQPAFGDIKYRVQVRLVSFDCGGNKFTYKKTEYYDTDARLVDIAAADPAKETTWTDIVPKNR
jgi:hypothetical protein